MCESAKPLTDPGGKVSVDLMVDCLSIRNLQHVKVAYERYSTCKSVVCNTIGGGRHASR